MNIADLLIEKIEGTEKPFGVEILSNGTVTIKKYFQTKQLAWCYGENWKMLNKKHDYRLC